jgi:hypothetical protein
VHWEAVRAHWGLGGEADGKRNIRVSGLILGGVLGACCIAEVTNPQWQAPSPPELKPYT